MTTLIQKAMLDNPVELTDAEIEQVTGGMDGFTTIADEELCWSEEMMRYWLEVRVWD